MKKYLAIIVTVSFVIGSFLTVTPFFGIEKSGAQQSAKTYRDDPGY
ncbi:hypothetical protein O0555_11005 [Brevibacillus laterosporus]|nr:hypothetical protein [Brevibacillus laterosporus]MCR8937876.1 hypothetical protein [Brevibacillus laterosporus]MCZ0840515.1 hypothetical protein [Brevibacillus laterosporus]MCZ0847431.1 hypothetical protein [Brevibacillus laterosporus]MED1911255.1 hypothetical protein [Brevibacillus laterosporus]